MDLSGANARNLSTLFLRIGLGSLFLVSWQGKLANPTALYQQVANSHLLAPPVDLMFATLLPYWEVAFGVCFLLGLFTRATAVAALLALASYSIYVAQPASQARLGFMGPIMLSHDVTFMLATIGMYMSGAGAYSVDALLAARRHVRRSWSALPASPRPEAGYQSELIR